MQNIFTKEKIIDFDKLVTSSNRISVITHSNPDGDAIGSASALKLILQKLYPGKQIRTFVPNAYPTFLQFFATKAPIEICKIDDSEKTSYIESSDLIIISDLNTLNRMEHISAIVNNNTMAKKVLIDHHENPVSLDLQFSNNHASSTCHIVFCLIQALEKSEYIDEDIATALYAGMITDTGCFSYSYLSPELFCAAGELVKKGADPVKIFQEIYNTQSVNRIKLLGYLISNKMEIIPERHAAYITITKEEKELYNYRTGDTEGVVNEPLSISGISTSALFSENEEYIKVSLRSQGKQIDVCKMAKDYFSGGGHFNASGGKFFGTMEEAVETYKKALKTL